jgi:hypothetical protein
MEGPGVRVWFVVAGWLAATAAGLAGLTVYANRPGSSGNAAAVWPADVLLPRARERATLVVALQPGCACSQATLEQLDRLAGSNPGAVQIVALIATYPEFPASQDVLGSKLASLHDVRRVIDPQAALARRFGAVTSGHALLYDVEGHLRFSGGLTRARGHAGDSAGLDFLRAWLEHRRPATGASAPIFGCALAHGTGAAS